MSESRSRGLSETDIETGRLVETILQTTGDGYALVGLTDRRIHDVNDRLCVILGYSRSELIGMPVADLSTEETEGEFNARTERIVQEGYGLFEVRLRRKHGPKIDMEISASYLGIDGGRLVCFCRDVSSRREMEAALRINEEKYRALFDQAADGIYLHDHNGQIVAVNQAACEQSGYSRQELLSRTIFDHLPPPGPDSPDADRDEITKIWSQWEPGDRVTMEVAHQRKDGTVQPVEVTTGVIRFSQERLMLAVVRDLTARKAAEEQLRKMQKLEALGILAGGIAHDFNNLLSGIFGYIDLAAYRTTDQAVAEYLSKAQATMSRAQALTQQLLTFAKGGAPVLRNEHLSPFLQDTVRFALSGSTVSCHFTLPDDLRPCRVDLNLLAQAIDNIVINAQQAMPDGGQIEVRARNVTLSTRNPLSLPEGRYVGVEVQDHGIGIPRENISRIFDPFYTTKPRGHGLGLSTSFSIVKRHQGSIDVTSETGLGTTISLYLPAAAKVSPTGQHQASGCYGGTGTIVILDDEEVVRDTLGQLLESFGFTVVSYERAEEAIAYAAGRIEQGAEVAAMFFDLTLPGGMGGQEAVKEARQFCPKELPIFVTSGYADAPIMAEPGRYGFTASIAKPLLRDNLEQLLKTYLP
jgi:PAS domain S-box-containing protein